MALVVGLALRIVEADRFTRAGRFHQEQSMEFLCHSLPGKALGLIGLGAIGEEIAKRARALSCQWSTRSATACRLKKERELRVEWFGDKAEVLRRADLLCIMASYDPTTQLLIGSREFALMKPTAFFSNTARRRVVDRSCTSGRSEDGQGRGPGRLLGRATRSEPNPNPEFFKLDRVILTPHIGSATWESRREMARLVAENKVAMVKGERPANVYNPAVYERLGEN
jgi:glyoxylate reductase